MNKIMDINIIRINSILIFIYNVFDNSFSSITKSFKYKSNSDNELDIVSKRLSKCFSSSEEIEPDDLILS